jgi:hypothetical protein
LIDPAGETGVPIASKDEIAEAILAKVDLLRTGTGVPGR